MQTNIVSFVLKKSKSIVVIITIIRKNVITFHCFDISSFFPTFLYHFYFWFTRNILTIILKRNSWNLIKSYFKIWKICRLKCETLIDMSKDRESQSCSRNWKTTSIIMISHLFSRDYYCLRSLEFPTIFSRVLLNCGCTTDQLSFTT